MQMLHMKNTLTPSMESFRDSSQSCGRKLEQLEKTHTGWLLKAVK